MKPKGFSLIEMMIVVAIMGIMAALASQMIGSYLLNVKLRSTAEELKESLDFSRSEAIKRNDTIKYTSLSGGGWKVEGYVNDILSTLKSKPSASGSKSVVTTDQAVIRFDGSGRSDVSATFQVTPVTGSCADITCLNVEVIKLGKIKLCNPASTNEVLKCGN
jgi:type IV fimbrial biogenesis protein FimT